MPVAVAVRVTLYVPGELVVGPKVVEMLRVEVAEPPDDRDTVRGFSESETVEGEALTMRLKLPEKPFWLVRVMVATPEKPTGILSDEGLDVTPKSGITTDTVRLVVREIVPLEPMIGTA